MIRKAHINEAHVIRDLINTFAKKDLLLPLSLSEIYEHVRDYFVFINETHMSFQITKGDKNPRQGFSNETLMPKFGTKEHENLQRFSGEISNNSQIIGVCALNIIWEDLAELRSLAVLKKCWRKGIGSKLVKACIQEASDLGIKKVFCLTYHKDFFSLLGFTEIDKSQLPHKIWADCLKCSKFPDCSEIAMIYEV